MNPQSSSILERLFTAYPSLECCKGQIEQAFSILLRCYQSGGTLFICGNGGSAADSEHIVGELMKGFLKKRPLTGQECTELLSLYPEDGSLLAQNLQGALPAISLVSHPALTTAFNNDVDPSMTFAQQVYGLGRQDDVFLGITTSGNSKNVLNAAKIAKWKGLFVLGMTGQGGGQLSSLCNACICVPETETYRVQELHLPVYHALCAMLEAEFFAE